jgi:predicted dehydrogenase
MGNYGGYYEDLYETIANGKSLKVTPQQAHNTIRMIELAFESNQHETTIDCSGLL